VEGAGWRYDGERYREVTALRRAEQAAMAAFGADGRCLMRALQEELDDPAPADCGRCSVCAGPRFAGEVDARLVQLAHRHLRAQPVVFAPKRMAPGADGAMRKIPDGVRTEEGRALARVGDGGWAPLVAEGRRAGRFADELVDGLAEVLRRDGRAYSWVAAVPSRRSGELVPDLGRRLAAALGVAYFDGVEEVAERAPQREMANAAQQAANVRGRFRVTGPPPAGAGVLVDDLRQSGWTLATVGGQLRQKGAAAVHPVALASVV
jgi:ATP-dependent DNA helicase RecQ